MNEDSKRLEVRHINKAREYWQKLKLWLHKVWHIKLDDDFADNEEFKSAQAYNQQFVIDKDVKYDQVVVYAQKLYEAYDKQDRNLDDKADSIIKYLGGGSAIVTIGALLSFKTDTLQTCLIGIVITLSLVPSMWQAMHAVGAAIKVRHPRLNAGPESIKKAIEIANYHKIPDDISIKLWLQLHAICEAYHFRNDRKSDQVTAAYLHYYRSIICLSIPILAVLFALFVSGCVVALKPKPLTPTPALTAQIDAKS